MSESYIEQLQQRLRESEQRERRLLAIVEVVAQRLRDDCTVFGVEPTSIHRICLLHAETQMVGAALAQPQADEPAECQGCSSPMCEVCGEDPKCYVGTGTHSIPAPVRDELSRFAAEERQRRAQPQGEQKQARGKRCTCDTSNGGSIPCYVESGGKLGDLWYCAKARQERGNG